MDHKKASESIKVHDPVHFMFINMLLFKLAQMWAFYEVKIMHYVKFVFETFQLLKLYYFIAYVGIFCV